MEIEISVTTVVYSSEPEALDAAVTTHQQSRGMFTPVADSQIEGGGAPSNKGRAPPLPCAQRTQMACGLPILEVRNWCDAIWRRVICCSQQKHTYNNWAWREVNPQSKYWMSVTLILSFWQRSLTSYGKLSTPISNYALTRSLSRQRGTNSPESCNGAGTHFPLYELEQSQAINAH